MYVWATCPHSVKAELRLFHSLPCNHIYVNIERHSTTVVVFQQNGTPHYSAYKFTLLLKLAFQIGRFEELDQ
jgi:glutaredoxin